MCAMTVAEAIDWAAAFADHVAATDPAAARSAVAWDPDIARVTAPIRRPMPIVWSVFDMDVDALRVCRLNRKEGAGPEDGSNQ